ncbi:redoxin family protein [Planosporangium sp. 12N6]|uniref:redoxin family protein n=1 Tax=Planosporangium spinosum TaxID=3402278 RepID=UPI003CEA2A55
MRVRFIPPVLATAALAALVALAGCGSGAAGDGAGGPGSTTAARAGGQGAALAGTASGSPGAAVPAPGAAVPDTLTFTARTLDGREFDGASLAGHPVVLWFWAPWCATCAGQAATVSNLSAEYKGKVDIVGVAGLGDEKDMRTFVSDLDVGDVTHLADRTGVVWKRFGITEQSTFVLIDRGGKVVTKGFMDSQQFNAWIRKLAA